MLARQLVVAFLLVTVPATGLLGAVTLQSLRALGTISQQLAEILVSLEATRELAVAVGETSVPVVAYLRNGDRAQRQALERIIGRVDTRLDSCGSASCHQMSRAPAEMVEALAPLVARLRQESRAAFDAAPGDDRVAATVVHTVSDLSATIHQRLDSMTLALLARVADLTRRSAIVSQRASVLVAWLTAGILAVACGAGVLFGRRISRPLRDLLFGIRRVMEGHWNHRVAASGRGELAELAQAFNTMVAELERSRAGLEEVNRTLEERVRERTEEVHQKDQALAHAEKLASLGLLASGVAHELNNPLTSVLMNTNLLMEEVGPDSPLHRDLRRIDADVGRCKRIIEDLRAFARRGELQVIAAQVEDVVEQALWTARGELERQAIKVERNVPADLPPVMLDPQRIVQVLTNLFVNAAQAMGQGGRLAVRARCGDGWLRMEVADTGPGIPLQHRSRIFDPFFTTKPDGTGLGLSITHGIVARHGGHIEVDSRTRDDVGPGEETGTTVRVRLPIQEVRW